jgi:hypothetical protein
MQWASSLIIYFSELDSANNVLGEQLETGKRLGITKVYEASLDTSVDTRVGGAVHELPVGECTLAPGSSMCPNTLCPIESLRKERILQAR